MCSACVGGVRIIIIIVHACWCSPILHMYFIFWLFTKQTIHSSSLSSPITSTYISKHTHTKNIRLDEMCALSLSLSLTPHTFSWEERDVHVQSFNNEMVMMDGWYNHLSHAAFMSFVVGGAFFFYFFAETITTLNHSFMYTCMHACIKIWVNE